MKFSKFERSGFIFETEKGFRLAIDIANKTPLEKLEGITVDAAISSHIHGDHFSLNQIKKLNPKKIYLSRECIRSIGEEILSSEMVIIKDKDNLLIGDILVSVFTVDHGPNVTMALKENFGFLLKADNTTIYFAGDMFYPSVIDVVDLEVDYAFLPVGTFYTMGPDEAFDFAKQFKKIGKVITMHDDIQPGSKEKFLKLANGVFKAE